MSSDPINGWTDISSASNESLSNVRSRRVDVEAELAKLDPAGWRPLRSAAPDLSTLDHA